MLWGPVELSAVIGIHVETDTQLPIINVTANFLSLINHYLFIHLHYIYLFIILNAYYRLEVFTHNSCFSAYLKDL